MNAPPDGRGEGSRRTVEEERRVCPPYGRMTIEELLAQAYTADREQRLAQRRLLREAERIRSRARPGPRPPVVISFHRPGPRRVIPPRRAA